MECPKPSGSSPSPSNHLDTELARSSERASLDWRTEAQCFGTDSNVFFSFNNYYKESQAKSICNMCTVAKQCLDWVLENPQEFGVWGGMNPQERTMYKRTLTPTDDSLLSVNAFCVHLFTTHGLAEMVERQQVYYWIRKGMPHSETSEGKLVDPDKATAWLVQEGILDEE